MTSFFNESELQQRTFVLHVEAFSSIHSTQDRAIELCSETARQFPALVVAEKQTAGRGRDGSKWWSPDGALLFSLVMPLTSHLASLEDSHQLSMAAAGAVADYLRETLVPFGGEDKVRLKWPNDVYLGEDKIAGLLIDVPHQRLYNDRLAVIGVGLNVNNSCQNCPAELETSAVSLADATNHSFDLQESLTSLLHHIERRLAAS